MQTAAKQSESGSGFCFIPTDNSSQKMFDKSGRVPSLSTQDVRHALRDKSLADPESSYFEIVARLEDLPQWQTISEKPLFPVQGGILLDRSGLTDTTLFRIHAALNGKASHGMASRSGIASIETPIQEPPERRTSGLCGIFAPCVQNIASIASKVANVAPLFNMHGLQPANDALFLPRISTPVRALG